MKQFHINKTVTRNFFLDMMASLQNMFGMNLTSYEKMVDKAMSAIKEESDSRGINPAWYRYEITQLVSGALSITFYGEEKE